MECALGTPGRAIIEHILKKRIVVIETDSGAEDSLSGFAGVPDNSELRSQVQVGLPHTIAESWDLSEVV